MNEKALVILSGGQDSTTCLYWARNRYSHVEAIGFRYGQKHSQEIQVAQEICDEIGVRYHILSTDILEAIGDSALVSGGDVNTTHSRKNLPASWVPNRNGFFFLVAHAFAQKHGFDTLVTGVCQTDYSGYPDCRNDFVIAMQTALNLGSESDIAIVAPLMYLDKGDIFAMADAEGALAAVLEKSLTCYNGVMNRHEWGRGCGQCPSCRLRGKGFLEFLERKR